MELELGSSSSESKKPRRRRNILAHAGPSTVNAVAQPLLNTLEIKRKKCILSLGEKHMLINLFKYLEKTKPEDKYLSNKDLVKMTSEISGVSERSIYRVLSEYRDTNKVSEPETRRKKPNVLKKISDGDKSAIRKIVHSFYYMGEHPTLKNILLAINEDESLPTLCMTSMRLILKGLNFKYVKRHRKSILIDRQDIIIWRIKYLRQIEAFRKSNQRIFYIDETWVNADNNSKEPTSEEKRLILVHVGNEEGFLEGCDWIFEARKTSDHHENIDPPLFEEWFSKVLEKLQPDDVIVLDNASYHSRHVEKTPTMAWRKKNIQGWLFSKNIAFESNEIKAQLMEKVKINKNVDQAYVIDEMAKQKGVTVLRLPPYHNELNPIELVWMDIKNYVTQQKEFGDLKKLLVDGIAQVTKDKWWYCVENVKKEESRMRELDHEIDKTVDKFISNVVDSDTSEPSSESEDSVYFE